MSQPVRSLENSLREEQDLQLGTSFKPHASLNACELFQNTQKTFVTVEDWHGSLQGKIFEIGKMGPGKAQAISQVLLNYQGTQDQKELLRQFDIVVPDNLYRLGLKGGMEAVLVGSVVPFIIKFLVEEIKGNKEKMDEEAEKQPIVATIQLSTGEIEGDHKGERVVVQTEESKGMFKKKQYELQARGEGTFVSDKVMYKGYFRENHFHDLTEAILYYCEHGMYYIGRFDMGTKSGEGRVIKALDKGNRIKPLNKGNIIMIHEEKEEKKEEKEVLIYNGTWKNDKPQNGFYYNESGERVVEIRDGFVQTNKNMTSFFNALPEFLRPPANPYNLKSFPIELHPLIVQKLEDPDKELTLDESLELLTTCLQHGNEHSEKIHNKEAIIVMGNTGSGKSTFINYLSGCTMEFKNPADLGFEGFEDIVVVKSGKEIMPIGHDVQKSRTFLPQVETDHQEQFTYCDCPGFLDNRGAEINIANAVNIRDIVMQAKCVKIIILINYHTLLADKGHGILEMFKICFDFFGKAENLDQYKNSLWLGITRVPEKISHDQLKKLIAKGKNPMRKILAERLFLFDYLNQDKDRLNRNVFLNYLRDTLPIEKPSQVFKIALTDSDEKKLISISKHMEKKIQTALEEKNFSLAAIYLKSLQNLSIIEHISVERILSQTTFCIQGYFQKIREDFRAYCIFEQLSEAKALLEGLEESLKYFNVDLNIDLSILKSEYEKVQNRQKEHLEKTHQMEKLIKEAREEAQKSIGFLEEQKQYSQEQFLIQQHDFLEIFQKMDNSIKEIKIFYELAQQRLQKEMQVMIDEKDKELKDAQKLSQKEINQKIEIMEKEYKERLRDLEQEGKERLEAMEVQKKEIESRMKKQKEEHDKTIQKFEKKIQELKSKKNFWDDCFIL